MKKEFVAAQFQAERLAIINDEKIKDLEAREKALAEEKEKFERMKKEFLENAEIIEPAEAIEPAEVIESSDLVKTAGELEILNKKDLIELCNKKGLDVNPQLKKEDIIKFIIAEGV